jgi:hypothetical protein
VVDLKSLLIMGVAAGLLLGVFVGVAPFPVDGACGDLCMAVALAGVPDSGLRLVADDALAGPSAPAWFEEAGDDEGTGERGGLPASLPAWRASGKAGAAGLVDRAWDLDDAARVSRCPLFLLFGRLVC